MKRSLLVLLTIVLGVYSKSFATHIVGGTLYYLALGNNQYAVTLVVYRDCLSGQAAFDNPANVAIYNASGGLVQNLNFTLDSVVDLQSTINSSCVTAPNNVCTEAGYYTEIVTLPSSPTGYTIAYQRCCRNSIVQNIVTPQDVGTTLIATIPGTQTATTNSSAVWNQLPPLYVCANLPFTFDHSATDPNGDQLVYSLCTPYSGASSGAPQPDPPAAPPYTPISWLPPYSLNDMMGGTPLIIDANTGLITATPGSVGTFLIGICVQEFRNGVLVGETRREVQINVVNCQAPVAMPDDINEILPNSFINCTEFVDFSASNTQGFNIWWDFGDPTTTLDQSTSSTTSWTYPGPGTYNLTLVVFNPINPNDPLCTDTVTQLVTIQDTVIPDAGPDQQTCPGIAVQLGAPANPGWTYSWSPATGLSNPTSAQPMANITQQTTYILTATDNVGCTGTDTVVVDLLVNAAADAGPDVQLCPGGSTQLNASGGVSYLWTPNTFISNVNIANPTVNPPTDTQYVVEVTSSDGCVGTDTVMVFVFVPSVTVSNDTTICAGDAITISVVGGSPVVWSPNVNISNVNSQTPIVNPTSTTTYVVNALDVNGCDATDSVTVSVQQLPVANAGTDVDICEGETVQLTASGGTTYSWSPANTLSNGSIATPIASPTSTTTYVVVVSDQVGCSDSDTVQVVVNALPTINAGPDGQVCNGVGFGLNATGGTSYSWTPVAGLSNANIANPIATPLVPTTYTVTGTDANGCSNTDDAVVDVFVVNAVGDTLVCIGDAAQIGVIGGASWTWSPSTGLSSASAQFPTAQPTSTTWYVVAADDGTGCLATDSVLVTVAQLPVAFAGFDQGVCAGSNAQLNASGGVTYQWSPATGLSNPNSQNPVVTFSSDTATYTVTVIDQNGCSNTDQVTVWQEQLPDVAAGPDTTVCFGSSVQLFATGGTSYSWTPATGLSSPNVANPVATPMSTTTYTVTVGQPTGNVVFNGDFNLGNQGFGSDYSYYAGGSGNMGESLFSVVTDANTIHSAFQGTGHTGNAPLDSFLVVNGSGSPNQNVWCQTVSVSPNSDYFFGAWVSTVVASSPAILQFSINGQVLGSPFTAPFNIGQWIQFSETWNSGTATTATICIVNQNTTLGGNDFAIDDISFSTICTNTAQVTVTVNPQPTADAGADQSICVGDVAQLQGSGGVSYQWVPPVGLSNPGISNPTASPNNTIVYTLIVADNIGCTDLDSMTLTVNPLPVVSAGPDFELCIGESVILQGTGGVDYSWSPGTYLDDPNAQLPESTPVQTITYTLTVTDINSCVNTDQTTITVNPLPIIDAGLDSMICANSTIVLHATGGISYAWSPLVGLSDPQSSDPAASPQVATVYHVIGTDVNGCSNTDSVSITIFGITAGPDSVICLNDSVQAFVSGGATFSWTPVEGVSDPTSASPYLSPDGTTVFTVIATSQFGCQASAEVEIGILTLPVSAFSATFEPSCDGIFARFDNTSENSETFYWTFGDGGTSGEFEPTHTFQPGQGSIVTLYTYNNDSLCVDSVLIDYSNQWFGNDTIEIDYPNVFTPNYDGINDCFRPGFDGRFSECYDLKIFNRWGALIFESTGGQNHCWDGRTKGGKFCDEGTYYYITSLKGYEKHGYVTLIY